MNIQIADVPENRFITYFTDLPPGETYEVRSFFTVAPGQHSEIACQQLSLESGRSSFF